MTFFSRHADRVVTHLYMYNSVADHLEKSVCKSWGQEEYHIENHIAEDLTMDHLDNLMSYVA